MNYSDEHRLVWFAPIRTASRAVGRVLRHLGLVDGVTGRSLMNAAHTHVLAIPRGKEDYRVICNVRNPFTRMPSIYTWAKPGVPFLKWVDSACEPWVLYEESLLRREFTSLRVESLAEDLRSIPEVASVLESSSLARQDFERFISVNQFRDVANFKAFYKSDQEIDAVRLRCAKQFEMFGYSTELGDAK